MVGAELKDLETGELIRVNAKIVVIAADAFRTPQLLWASGIRPWALGRFLNDHPQTTAAVRISGGAMREAAEGRVSVSARDDRDVLTNIYWVPYNEESHPFHGQVMLMEPAYYDRHSIAQPYVELAWYARKELSPEDRVTFSESLLDGFGMPRISIQYRYTESDRKTQGEARDLVIAAASALGEMKPGGPALLAPGKSLHYQGTVRMGEYDDGSSVCDSFGLVWGLTNLYLGGTGVIPTQTACNPTLTSVALAARSATSISAALN